MLDQTTQAAAAFHQHLVDGAGIPGAFKVLGSDVPPLVYRVETSAGWDVEVDGVEVGSYGHNELRDGDAPFVWVYGTGLAEPRLSQAIARLKKETA